MSVKAWAYLNRVFEGPHPLVHEVIDELGVRETATRISSRAHLPEAILKATESRHADNRSEADLAAAAEAGFRLIHPGHLEWPGAELECFAALDSSDRADAPPIALWVRGQELPSLLHDAVAFVGTRAATRYGQEVATTLARECVAAGATIISGGALGIDAAAHKAALVNKGRTIAVLACGPGVSYPAAHQGLFERISLDGAVISEYPPGTPPARYRFLTRNRLVAVLSQATVLVEAGWRSGARNTANWALRLNKPLAAVPGPITSAASSGCHDLIRNNQAVLVTSAENIQALYQRVGSVDEDGQLELDWAKTTVQGLSRNELAVYDALPQAGAVSVRDIATAAGFTVALSTHLLLDLAQRGVVHRADGGWSRN